MISIDRRTGSNDLQQHMQAPSLLVELEFGDVCFSGNGPDGDVLIGIERKKIPDLIGSINTGRLSGHQLPGLMKQYDVVYLVIEGIVRADKQTDELLVSKDGGKSFRSASHGKHVWTMEGMTHYLTTLSVICGVKIIVSKSIRDTVKHIEYLYSWWQKPWAKHTSHLALHKGKQFTLNNHRVSMMPPQLSKPSLVRRVAAELPNISIDRSIEVDQFFKSVDEMVNASEETWRRIPSIGKITAKNVYNAIRKKNAR